MSQTTDSGRNAGTAGSSRAPVPPSTKNWRSAAVRMLMQHNPLLPFRGRLSCLAGHVAIPEGVVVNTRFGIRVGVHADEMYRSVYLNGVYEPFHTKIFLRIVRPRARVLDIGTNFGWYAALFSNWVGRKGFVHAFEPVAFIHEYAKETLRLNVSGENVRLNRCALGAEKGKIQVYTFLNLPHGHASTTNLGRDDALAHDCQVTTLDEYAEAVGLRDCLFMKVDVEGHELEVFRGASDFLKNQMAPIISFEVNVDCLSHRGLRPGDLMDCLRAYGYTAFYAFSARIGVQAVKQLGSCTDYLAVKPVRAADVAPALRTGRIFV